MARLLFMSVIAALFSVSIGNSATFVPLGDIPGGTLGSYARAVSANGKVVVGSSGSPFAESDEAFRWTGPTGMLGIGDLPGSFFASIAYGASADGSVIVGTGRSGNPNDRQEAFRWSESSGMIGLGFVSGLPGTVYSHGNAVSADGAVIVGNSGPIDVSNSSRAFRWTQSTGIVDIGLPVNTVQGSASDVSADGSKIVGVAWTAAIGQPPQDVPEAFLWSESSGFFPLGDLPGGDFASAATGISGNGLVVIGHSNSDLGGEVFRWTAESGMVALGDLPGGQVNATPWATNFDGSIIVGQGNVGASSPSGEAAFIWDAANGMRNLQSVLQNDYGLGLAGWHLGAAVDVSADGRVIVGTGIDPTGNQQAWLVELPVPEPSSGALCLVLAALAITSRKCRRRA